MSKKSRSNVQPIKPATETTADAPVSFKEIEKPVAAVVEEETISVPDDDKKEEKSSFSSYGTFRDANTSLDADQYHVSFKYDDAPDVIEHSYPFAKSIKKAKAAVVEEAAKQNRSAIIVDVHEMDEDEARDLGLIPDIWDDDDEDDED